MATTFADIEKNPATPRWAKEIFTYLPVKAQFVLYGNIRDSFAFPTGAGKYDLRKLHTYLSDVLFAIGYETFLLVDPVNGASVIVPSEKRADKDGGKDYLSKTTDWLSKINKSVPGEIPAVDFIENKMSRRWCAPLEFPRAVAFLDALVRQNERRVAVFFDYLMGTGKQAENAPDAFIRSLILSYEAVPYMGAYVHEGEPFRNYNTVFWCCDRENELPAWFALNNPRVRSISVGRPDVSTRRLICEIKLRDSETPVGTSCYRELKPNEQESILNDFVAQSDGMTLNDIHSIAVFRVIRKLDVRRIADAARRYKLGITEDPWKDMVKDRTPKAFAEEVREVLLGRVKGQPQAVERATLVVRKALRGISGAQAGMGRPKGVLFLAGPTGTGKTELAKSLTKAIFGDERAYIRFDMSEFSAEHTDQRLLGAPPGYLGFESGGELTRAIREKPCAVVLFDEIEKAHERLWDKFLAILDDGQITSGKGERVYFSESVIVFTSNLGMSAVNERFGHSGELPSYEEMSAVINSEINRYFTEKLKRPELRNRLGDNIVIFDFIRKDSAIEILEKQIAMVRQRFIDQEGVEIVMPRVTTESSAPIVTTLLEECCGNLFNGGRGIGNRLDTVLVGPLALWLDEIQPKSGSKYTLTSIEKIDGRFRVALAPVG